MHFKHTLLAAATLALAAIALACAAAPAARRFQSVFVDLAVEGAAADVEHAGGLAFGANGRRTVEHPRGEALGDSRDGAAALSAAGAVLLLAPALPGQAARAAATDSSRMSIASAKWASGMVIGARKRITLP